MSHNSPPTRALISGAPPALPPRPGAAQWFQLRSERRWGPLFTAARVSPAHNKSLSYRKGREREGGRRRGRGQPAQSPSPPRKEWDCPPSPPRCPLWCCFEKGSPPQSTANIWGACLRFLSLTRVSSVSRSPLACPGAPSLFWSPQCVPVLPSMSWIPQFVLVSPSMSPMSLLCSDPHPACPRCSWCVLVPPQHISVPLSASQSPPVCPRSPQQVPDLPMFPSSPTGVSQFHPVCPSPPTLSCCPGFGDRGVGHCGGRMWVVPCHPV